MRVLGYARGSTQDQDLGGQIKALKGAGATTIYREKVSGVMADRPQLAKLMAALEPGDLMVVTKLDRLGRSTRELLNLIDRISKVGAAFRSLSERAVMRRALAFHPARRHRGVRARVDPGAYRREPQAGYGRGRQVWPQAQALTLPAGRGH